MSPSPPLIVQNPAMGPEELETTLVVPDPTFGQLGN